MQSTVQIRSDQNLKGTRSGLFHDEAARFFIGIRQKNDPCMYFCRDRILSTKVCGQGPIAITEPGNPDRLSRKLPEDFRIRTARVL